jgi:hypothetical protein
MARDEFKLFTTPVSVNDGFKRSDSRTWATLGILAVAAVLIVVLVNVFVEKPKVHWPTSPGPQAAPSAPAAPTTPDEPKTYDVAPRAAKPQ